MYILEGNIGVGKSTFLKKIQEHLPELEVLTEPVNNWSNQMFGQSLLENFYKDTSRWAFTLENLAMIYRVKDHIEIQQKKNPNIIMERSIYSGHYCFAKNSFANGHLSNLEWEIYQNWIDLLHKSCEPPKGFIYLKANPETCIKRIKKRNRLSEKTITLGYIKQIDKWHNKFLLKKEDLDLNLVKVPVLTIDCNKDFENKTSLLKEHLNKVKDFINQTNKTNHKQIIQKQSFSQQNL